VEVFIAQPESFLGSVLRARLDEVELAWRELQIGAEGVEQIARDFLTVVCLGLLDEPERFLGDDDSVGGHLRRLLGPVSGAGRN
jgi:hypothetical protein